MHIKQLLFASLLLTAGSAFAGSGCTSGNPCTITIKNDTSDVAEAHKRLMDHISQAPIRWNSMNDYKIPPFSGVEASIYPTEYPKSSSECESMQFPIILHYEMKERGKPKGECTLMTVMHCLGGYTTSNFSNDITYVLGMLAEATTGTCTGPYIVASKLQDEINPEEMGEHGSGITGYQSVGLAILPAR